LEGKKGIIMAGIIIGFLAVALVSLGNPVNMGLCIVCFIRDTVGSLGLHRAKVVQYIRPEILGIVLGAFFMALSKREFRARGGSAPFIRFILGFFVVIGALMFLGCPLRMILRLAGGDLNAIFGLLGFATGILIGIKFLNKGFTLKRAFSLSQFEGYAFPAVAVVLLVFALIIPEFILVSETGPGAAHAPLFFALAAGLIVGLLAQCTRLCMVGGIRDFVMFRDSYLLTGFMAIFVTTLVGNIVLNKFTPGFAGQSVAHTDGLWNFLGMALAGWGSVMLGGCPLRQLVLAGEGNIDSVITVMGMAAGAAFAHNFSLAASAKGPALNGRIAVIIGFMVLFIIAYFNLDRSTGVKMKGGAEIDLSAN
jgi:YedE family putative selenium metabolism protein